MIQTYIDSARKLKAKLKFAEEVVAFFFEMIKGIEPVLISAKQEEATKVSNELAELTAAVIRKSI